MEWIFASVVLVLLVVYPGFRKFALIGAGSVIVLIIAFGGVLFVYEKYIKGDRMVDPSTGLTSLQSSDYRFSDMKLGRPDYSYSTLRGRVHNLSNEYHITNFTLRVVVADCRWGDSKKTQTLKPWEEARILDQARDGVGSEKCAVIGQSDKLIQLDVPPGQARDFSDSISWEEEMSIKGQMYFFRKTVEVLGRKKDKSQ